MAASTQAQEIIDEFTFLDDWEERYQHLIDLGRRLPPLDEAHKVEEKPSARLSVGGAFQG